MLASVLGVFATIVVATAIGGSGSNASLSKEFPRQFLLPAAPAGGWQRATSAPYLPQPPTSEER